jgi:excisionase family DNA binding protein
MAIWLTIDQAATTLGLHRSTVIRQIREGTIKGARRIGRQYRVSAEALRPPRLPVDPQEWPHVGSRVDSPALDANAIPPQLRTALAALAAAVSEADRAEVLHGIGSPADAEARAELCIVGRDCVRVAEALGLVEVTR